MERGEGWGQELALTGEMDTAAHCMYANPQLAALPSLAGLG